MSDDFIYYYQQELESLRKLGEEFSENNPKIARRLRFSSGDIDDPHVERLLEGAAFLAGRTQKRLEDEYPELTDAMLDILFPSLLSPMPSVSIIELPVTSSTILLEKGTSFTTASPEGETYIFRNTMTVGLSPIKAEEAVFEIQPFTAPKHSKINNAKSCVRISLKLLDSEATFEEVALESLCFYLNASEEQAISLFELMTQHLVGMLIADGSNDLNPVFVSSPKINLPGFDPENSLLPWPKQSFSGFRLLQEYFTCPQKFLFLEWNDLKTYFAQEKKSEKFLYFFFDATNKSFEKTFPKNILKLNCVPIINLFEGAVDPISLNFQKTSYPLTVDYLKERDVFEIWKVQEIYEILEDGSKGYWKPLYQNFAYSEEKILGRYMLGRRFSPSNGKLELFLNPIDYNIDKEQDFTSILSINAWLHNGNLPSTLPFGRGAPYFKNSSFQNIETLRPPSRCRRPVLHDKKAWNLISHLTLDHLCNVSGQEGATTVKQLLSLYDICQTAETSLLIKSLISVTATSMVMRHPKKIPLAFCNGIKVSLTFDGKLWHQHGIYLLSCILERFLALHVSINSFVMTSAYLTTYEDPIAVFPARVGLQEFL